MTPKEVVRAFVDAHNAHDLDRLMACLTDDSVMIDVAAPIPLNSKADVRKLFTMIFSALPDIHFEITGMISEGDKAFAALRTTGTGHGDWAGHDITGKRCDVFESMFVDVQDDRIKTCMFYSDTATLSRQLGDYAPALDMKPGTANIM
ncbi:putative ester cyclase [Variovorax sp. PBS-H4]|uniref:nuclear transport factor 2 family protein n=1 Tax=Variovorax sp. PBS-H4 TaxID=434008 RepID=UPI00131954BF|nr:ester cyclase [Variovorax sp. PBS-H4]VTU37660.1 putative ester cyclase [Variovorax sp. PBS-H4]